MSRKKEASAPLPSIHYAEALERIGGDESFLKELFNLYVQDFGARYVHLQKAVRQKDFRQIEELGHSLRGASANLSLSSLQKVSLDLEIAGKKKNIHKAKEMLSLLEREFKKLKKFCDQKQNIFGELSL